MTNTVFPNNEQHRLDLITELSAAQSKFTYFMMSAAGAGLGFAITQAGPGNANWALSMLFVAMLCWCVSFYAGIRKIMLSHSIVALALKAEEAQLTTTPKVGSFEQQVKALSDEWGDKTVASTKWQIISFLSGAVSMAVWRLWEVLGEISK